ncbi:hypothetical protein SLEP1_g58418 [Rubroshorea leprosula]|uniref:KIB1-4 beta-propeller domain-containing protein n=1 Tax=Rubroshorea leprosula TaxID=152421 RepID=A0AAV5MQR7_9ROSI|nr:hypothetical protein SLEP1_g58418 [Rubroshorea leprosula]
MENGAVYFLDEYGNLGIYREVGNEEGGERKGGGTAGYGDGDEPGDDEDGEEAEAHGDEIEDEDGEGDRGEGEGHGDGDEAQDEHGEGEEEGHGDEAGDGDEDHEVLDHVVLCPCESFHQKFLLECDGKLVSIFVGFLGEWVEIFSLDENDKVWVEVEDFGNRTIFISRFSAFSMVAPPGLQNRIYFPRFYGKNRVVYYSLESMQLHAHGMDEVLEDFYDTTEQLLCGWITPHFLFID